MINEIRTTQMRTTAALMAHDFSMTGAEETERAGIVKFVILVGEDRQAEAEEIMQLCGDGFNIDDSLQVSLGKYERSLQRLRKLIWVFKEEVQDDKGEKRPQRGSTKREIRT